MFINETDLILLDKKAIINNFKLTNLDELPYYVHDDKVVSSTNSQGKCSNVSSSNSQGKCSNVSSSNSRSECSSVSSRKQRSCYPGSNSPHNTNSFSNKINIEILKSVDSTNTYLQQKIKESTCSPGTIILAEEQFKGRGRNERKWVSPFGKNVYMSIYWKFNNNFKLRNLEKIPYYLRDDADSSPNDLTAGFNSSSISSLSLIIGLALVKALIKFNKTDLNNKLNDDDIRIKWPNDVYIKEKKLAGILIETINKGKNIDAIIGIGINVNNDTSINTIDNSISLQEISKEQLNRNNLVSLVISEIFASLDIFNKRGFEYFKKDWLKYDFLYNKTIEVVADAKTTYKGVMQGVDNLGGLLLLSEESSKIRKIYNVQKIIYKND